MITRIQIQKVTLERFVAAIDEKLMNDLRRAKRNYLLCKAAIERRKRELAALLHEGDDTSKLERMIKRLQASRDAHRELIARLENK